MNEANVASKLRPEVKAAWLTALRSGKYKQAQGRLKTFRGGTQAAYCCLGVLCDIAPPEVGHWDGEAFVDAEPTDGFQNRDGGGLPTLTYAWAFEDDGTTGKYLLGTTVTSAASREAAERYNAEWADAHLDDPYLSVDNTNPPEEASNLIDMNDNIEATFDEIADAIEAYL